MKNSYFKELTLNLQHEGFTVGPEENGLLSVELDGRHLCCAVENGGVRYRAEDVSNDDRGAALDKVAAIAEATREYMLQMESAPRLTASGLEGDYRLLANFNNTVLAGHSTKYGVQLVTWERVQNQTALHQGHYYGPNTGIDGYTAAKRDFATRSGLIPASALFTPEQLMEIYHGSTEALAGAYPITNEQQKCLKSIIEQIEHSVPDLSEHLQKEWDFSALEVSEDSGMQFS